MASKKLEALRAHNDMFRKDVIEVVEMAFSELQRGTATLPLRTGIALSREAGWMGVMPAYLEKMGSLSTKIVTVFEKNLEKKGNRHRQKSRLKKRLFQDVENQPKPAQNRQKTSRGQKMEKVTA